MAQISLKTITREMRTVALNHALKVGVIYAVVGALWILFSDRALVEVLQDPQLVIEFQTYKGWFFILVTALLVFVLVFRTAKRLLQSQAELTVNERRLKTAQRIGRIGDWEYTPETGHLYWSEEMYRLFGYNPDFPPISADRWFELIHEDDRDSVKRSYEEAMSDGKPAEVDFRVVLKSGVHRIISAFGEVVYDPDGDLKSIRGTCQDITEHQLAQEALRRSEEQLSQSRKMEAIGQLAGGVAHDFNNLLQVIQGATELAKMELSGAQLSRNYLDEVLQASERGSTLARQLLTFSRREKLHPQFLDVGSVITSLTSMLKRVIGEQVELTVLAAEDLKTVFADRSQIEQVVLNLCVNARDAMKNGGKLLIEVNTFSLSQPQAAGRPRACEGEYVAISISDTGDGIPPEIRERIFEPFFTTKDVGQGTGLGLATVYAIIEKHRGFIDVHSQMGKGTTFRVCLPVSEGKIEADSVPAGKTDLEGGRGETVLIAEDEDLVRDLAIRILENSGYRVVVATDGDEAIRVFEENKDTIDLALLDVVMPKKSGRDVYDHIITSRPQTRILFSSGYSYDDFKKDQGLEYELHTIQKPYRPQQLLRKIREMLDLKQRSI